MARELLCWNCGTSLAALPLPISRHAHCEKCFEVLHCCRMCRHYEPDRRPYCDHERAEPPVEKETANFCEFFRPVNRYEKSSAAGSDKARNDFAALFGDEREAGSRTDDFTGDTARDPDDPLSRLGDLFDD